MPKWNWKEDMYGLRQPFTIKTPDGNVVDLTGYTVTLYVWLGAALEFSLAGSLHGDPTTGICYFTPTVGQFDNADKFRFEVELTKAGAVVKTKNYVVECTGTRP